MLALQQPSSASLASPPADAREDSTFPLWPSEPPNQVGAVDEQASAGRWRDGIREHLGQCLTLQVEICAGIAHRRVQSSMTEPLADRREVDPPP
jgi:hypothetical protein